MAKDLKTCYMCSEGMHFSCRLIFAANYNDTTNETTWKDCQCQKGDCNWKEMPYV